MCICEWGPLRVEDACLCDGQGLLSGMRDASMEIPVGQMPVVKIAPGRGVTAGEKYRMVGATIPIDPLRPLAVAAKISNGASP